MPQSETGTNATDFDISTQIVFKPHVFVFIVWSNSFPCLL